MSFVPILRYYIYYIPVAFNSGKYCGVTEHTLVVTHFAKNIMWMVAWWVNDSNVYSVTEMIADIPLPTEYLQVARRRVFVSG